MNTVKNLYEIGKSRFETTAARPDAFILPSLSGDEENLKLLVPQHELEEVTEYVSITGEENDYQDYFEYVQV